MASNENRLPVAREGWPFILIPLAAAALAVWIGWEWPAAVLAAVGLFSAWFFRDPERVTPEDGHAVVSPADGTIVKITPTDENGFLGDRRLQISIFMSLFNVHVNRAPLSGTVETVQYSPGKFLAANLDKASLENERNAILIQTSSRYRLLVIQIAGLIARRIACWVKPGDAVVRGQRFGLIRFGSRLDVFLPLDTDVRVQLKQKVKAGETILGYLPFDADVQVREEQRLKAGESILEGRHE